MIGKTSRRGFRVTARKLTESVLAGHNSRCVECGDKLTEEEVRFTYQLRTTQPRCGSCGGYSVDLTTSNDEGKTRRKEFEAWTNIERSTEILH